MPQKYYALALTEDQCRAVMGACSSASLLISENPEIYKRILEGTERTPLELQGLYASVVIYVEEKLEEK